MPARIDDRDPRGDGKLVVLNDREKTEPSFQIAADHRDGSALATCEFDELRRVRRDADRHGRPGRPFRCAVLNRRLAEKPKGL